MSTITLMDALDLAALIELEARKRYEQFSESLGTGREGDAAIFQMMAVNENKHCEQIAERRLELFGETPPNVKLADIFDVEAPEFGATRWDMSPLKAYLVALSSEQKAYDFYDDALRHVTQPDVKALFEELREEEAEHVAMVKELIANLPPSAADELEDEDYDPDQPVRNSSEM